MYSSFLWILPKWTKGREAPVMPNLLCKVLVILMENLIIGLFRLARFLGQYHMDVEEICLLCSLII